MLQVVVFGLFADQVGAGELELGGGAFRGEQIEVAQLVVAAPEVVGFEVAFFQQGLDEEVGLAQADPQALGELALAEVRLGGEQVEDFELGVFPGIHDLP